MPSDATCGWPCVSSRAHHPAHYSAHGHMQRRTCARLPMSTCATLHTHTAPLSHALGLTHLCAHAHMHMHTARQTASHTDGISQERHTKTRACTHMHIQILTHSCLHTHMNTHEHTQLPTYTHTHSHLQRSYIHTRPHTDAYIHKYTHEHTQTHKEHARAHKYTNFHHTQALIHTGFRV